MADPGDLYQEVILDHGRTPRNFRRPAGAHRTARGQNPLCGDEVAVHLKIDGERIEDLSFEGAGCAIAIASASLMTDCLGGKTRAEAEALLERFQSLLAKPASGRPGGEIGKLAALLAVREFPARVKCALLAWHALRAALDGRSEPVSTES